MRTFGASQHPDMRETHDIYSVSCAFAGVRCERTFFAFCVCVCVCVCVCFGLDSVFARTRCAMPSLPRPLFLVHDRTATTQRMISKQAGH